MSRIDGQGGLKLRHAFLLPNFRRNGSVDARRHATTAAFKFTNTTLGGNFTINNPPQFTPTCDIRQPGRGRTEADAAFGMGSYYSEAIDDPKQVIHMSMGVPRYSSWTSFFVNFYDRNAALLANTGRVSGKWYNAGLLGGYVVTLPLQPFILGVTAASRVYNFLAKNSPSKWYYFKPAMHSYWSAVNVITNEICIGLDIIPRAINTGTTASELQDKSSQVTDLDIQKMHEMFPDLFLPTGGIDVFSLANRSQRMANRSQLAMEKARENAASVDATADATRTQLERERRDGIQSGSFFANGREYFNAAVSADNEPTLEGDAKSLTGTESFGQFSELKGVYNFITAQQRDGSQFATFRVNHVGSVSETFSSSTRESDVVQAMNSKVAQGRQASFNLMGGNISSTIGEIVDSVQAFVAGGLDSVKLGGLATLAGTAFLNVPKMWDMSTVSLPRADYTIPLHSPYGNKISRLINMYIPIAMAMATAMPLSAGRSAFTSPFLVQIYHQGRVQCQLGMVESLTITRGTGNIGFNADNEMLGAEITMSVVDLSGVMSLPIKGGFLGNDWIGNAISAGATMVGEAVGGEAGAATAMALTNSMVWDEQSLFSDYMAVLTSMSLADSYYVGKRLNLNLTRALADFRTWKSPSNFMSYVLDGGTARAISAFSQFTDRF